MFRFSTKYFDEEVGFYYYGFRFYSPGLGRWVTRDPKGERGGYNLFAFVNNSPVIYVDPFGLNPFVRIKGAVRIVIGAVGDTVALGGLGVGGVTEAGTLGASSPVSIPVMVGSSLLLVASTDQIVTGWNELTTGNNEVSQTEEVLAQVGEIEREYDVAGHLMTIETSLGQYWLVPISQGASATLSACSNYVVEVRLAGKRLPAWKGSGPVPGTIGVNLSSKSIKALQNYNPKQGGIEFVFDPKTNTFVTGAPKGSAFIGSPHQKLAQTIGANESTVVGGIFRRGQAGQILTNEMSGHYWQNWSPQVRQQFVEIMNNYGLVVTHAGGM